MLNYDPVTGLLTWKISRRGCRKGQEVGCLGTNGYVYVRVKRKLYLAHRLIWFLVTKEWPKDQLDHINGCRADNRLCNLREATNQQNSWNKKNVSGVYVRIRKNRPGVWYEVKIEKDGKKYGTYKRNYQDAITWREVKEKELFGAFSKGNL